jgi:hypothetical protein
MAAIRGNPRMPPYLLIETSWKAEGKKFEGKNGTNSRNGTQHGGWPFGFFALRIK